MKIKITSPVQHNGKSLVEGAEITTSDAEDGMTEAQATALVEAGAAEDVTPAAKGGGAKP